MADSPRKLTFLFLLPLLLILLNGCQVIQGSLQEDRMDQNSPLDSGDVVADKPNAVTWSDEIADSAEHPDFIPESDEQTESNAFRADQEQIQQEATAPASADLWQKLRSGFALPHEANRERVAAELRWYANHAQYIDRVTARATPHLQYIVSELERREMPMEFALLPIVESAFDPFAYSHGRAAGLWQFIPPTARVYGLKIDWWYDGRRDVRASTNAALDYLTYLHDMFDGDWLLALAAYNAGEGNVQSSIRKKLRKDGRPSDADYTLDFWTLDVLKETHSYVPRLLAISELINNPGKYNITLPPISTDTYWQAVETGGQIDLNRAANLAQMSSEDLYFLNPGYNQWATHPEGPHELLVPVDKVTTFEENLAMLPASERVSWVRHKISNGENLGSIAKKYNTTTAAIRSANNINGSVIRAGDSVLIPSPSAGQVYSMTEDSRLASRQELLKERLDLKPFNHVVQPGDSLWKISREYKVNMRDIARWNAIGTTSTLVPGQELLVFVKNAAVSQQIRALPAEKIRKLNYRVRNGESLARIAQKFNLSVNSIKSWNQDLQGQKYIHPGDMLTLYVDVTSLIR